MCAGVGRKCGEEVWVQVWVRAWVQAWGVGGGLGVLQRGWQRGFSQSLCPAPIPYPLPIPPIPLPMLWQAAATSAAASAELMERRLWDATLSHGSLMEIGFGDQKLEITVSRHMTFAQLVAEATRYWAIGKTGQRELEGSRAHGVGGFLMTCR